jgi:rSAM/selenodomain-associated transferase 2
VISVVIPVLNEAETLPALLRALIDEPTNAEIIVVDGGSTDGTADAVARFPVQLVRAPAGRGRQLRAGADVARGDILLFLHADTRFPPGGLQAIETALMRDPEAVGGNFRLLFDGGDAFSAWLNGFYAWIRAHGVYYGDSGIFARRAVHDRIGGMRPLALMEDFEFTRRLERHGPTLCLDQPPLTTSSRRFAGRRPVAIVCGWLWIHGLYYLGVSPRILAWLYGSRRPAMPRT